MLFENDLLRKALGDGQLVQFIARFENDEAEGSDQWCTIVSADEIRQNYRDWPAHPNNSVEEVSMLSTHAKRLFTADR